MSSDERRRFSGLIILDVLISVLDIIFLAFLIFVIHVYTQPGSTSLYTFLPKWLFDSNSLFLIAIFFLLFSIKNLVGFAIHRAQSRFIGNVATRLSRDKLIEYLDGGRVELYDLAHDVGEQRDLSAEQPALAAALREKLHRWRASVGAEMPTTNPHYDPRKAHLWTVRTGKNGEPPPLEPLQGLPVRYGPGEL